MFIELKKKLKFLNRVLWIAFQGFQIVSLDKSIYLFVFLIDPYSKCIFSDPLSHTHRCIAGVSNCYVFKSRLQEYCQKAGLRTPAYETIKEGPSHEPYFRSTVIANDVRYDSLPGFFNRKAAEQSAAEVALIALANSTNTEFGIAQHVVSVFVFVLYLSFY